MSVETHNKSSKGLIISVALNGLLVGLLAAALLWGGPKHRGAAGGPPPEGAVGDAAMARAVIQSAPSADRAKLRRLMREAWEDTRADRMLMRETRNAIAERVASGDYEEAQLNAEFAKLREADMRIKQTVQSALTVALGELPPESREKLSKAIAEHEARRGERRQRFRDRLRERRN